MGAQAALAVYYISDIAANTIGLLKEQNILTRSFAERATRSQQRITGFSGSTIWLNECDPVLTIDISGWMLARGGLANMHPGGKIDASIIANWRNGALAEGQEDHFGWDVMGGWSFIARNPSVTRGPGRLSDFSITLALECTARGSAIPTLPGDNNTDPPPDVGTTWYITTVYTDAGSYQVTSQTPPASPSQVPGIGSSAGAWDEGPPPQRLIPGLRGSDPPAIPPINVLGISYAQIDGSPPEWIAGSSLEVTGGGLDLFESGPDQWVVVYPDYGGSLPPDRSKMRLVCGTLPDMESMLAVLDPPATESSLAGIYHHGEAWLKNFPEPTDDNALEWFQT